MSLEERKPCDGGYIQYMPSSVWQKLATIPCRGKLVRYESNRRLPLCVISESVPWESEDEGSGEEGSGREGRWRFPCYLSDVTCDESPPTDKKQIDRGRAGEGEREGIFTSPLQSCQSGYSADPLQESRLGQKLLKQIQPLCRAMPERMEAMPDKGFESLCPWGRTGIHRES